MTRFEHIAWYFAIISNVYSASGNGAFMLVFGVAALAALVASRFERKQ